MMYMYLRSTLLTAFIFGGMIHTMDHTPQIQTQANQDLLNAAFHGNCASIRNALNRGAQPHCFGIVKVPEKPITPAIPLSAPTTAQTVELFVTSLAPGKAAQPVPALPLIATVECTPLHLAAKNGHYDAVRMLLEAGADARLSTRTNTTTPLHAAMQGDTRGMKILSEVRSNIATLLIKHGAGIHTKDFTGKSALDYLQPTDKESTDKKYALLNHYKWKQGLHYSTWICGTVVIGIICIGIQKLYKKYWHNHRSIPDEKTEQSSDNGARNEEQ